MKIVIQIAQLLLSLSILVILHEMGHFLFARLFKTRVEKFYLFFNPWFSIFKVKKGDTEYGLGWLPLGGYVKISGMIDESFDKEQMKQPPKPWEFRSKPAWQRLLIMLGGVLVNFLLAIIIFIFVKFAWGDDFLPNQNAKFGIAVDSLAMEAGFKDGDKVLTIEGEEVAYFHDIFDQIIFDEARNFTVSRDGQEIKVSFSDSIANMIVKEKSWFIEPRLQFIIDTLLPGSYADSCGLMAGDRIIGLNDTPTPYYHQYKAAIKKFHKKHFGQAELEGIKDSYTVDLTLDVIRGGDTITVPCMVNKEATLGVFNNPSDQFDYEHIDYSIIEAVPVGITTGFNTLTRYIKQFKLIFNKETEGYKEIGGFGTIAKLFGNSWDWQRFWSMTALLSVILAFMNVLPIPALDGGHVLFLLYEMVTGRKPGDKFMEYAQIIGLVIVVMLLIYANGLDFLRGCTG